MKKIIFSALGGCALVFGLVAPAPSADGKEALVIGINDYSQAHAPALSGCENDAKSMAAVLSARGYKVTSLLGSQATHQRILSELASSKSSEIVVYVAGYGAGPSQPRILCADTRQVSDKARTLSNCLTLPELNAALLNTSATQRVAILDVSFVGVRDAKGGPSLNTVRFYNPNPTDARDVTTSSDIPGFDHKKINVISASRFDEAAVESDVGGVSDGVFSRCLINKLKSNPQLSWQELQLAVSSQLANETHDAQHPGFVGDAVASYQNSGTALGGNAKGQTSLPDGDVGGPPSLKMDASGSTSYKGNAWDLYNLDHHDAQTLKIDMTPSVSHVKVEQAVKLAVQSQRTGFLVIVNHTAEDTFNVIYPAERAQGCQVAAGQTIEIPGSGLTMSPDRAGRERVKAFLFSTSGAAQSFLDSLPQSGMKFEAASTALGGRGLVIRFAGVSGGESPLVTADLSFEVVP